LQTSPFENKVSGLLFQQVRAPSCRGKQSHASRTSRHCPVRIRISGCARAPPHQRPRGVSSVSAANNNFAASSLATYRSHMTQHKFSRRSTCHHSIKSQHNNTFSRMLLPLPHPPPSDAVARQIEQCYLANFISVIFIPAKRSESEFGTIHSTSKRFPVPNHFLESQKSPRSRRVRLRDLQMQTRTRRSAPETEVRIHEIRRTVISKKWRESDIPPGTSESFASRAKKAKCLFRKYQQRGRLAQIGPPHRAHITQLRLPMHHRIHQRNSIAREPLVFAPTLQT